MMTFGKPWPVYLKKVSEVSLYFVLFCLPISNAMLGVALAVFLLSWLIMKIQMRKWPLVPWAFGVTASIFFAVHVLSFFLSAHPEMGQKTLFSKTGGGILLAFAIADTCADKRILLNGFKVLIGSAVLMVFDGAWQYVFNFDFLRGHAPAILDVRHRESRMLEYLVYSVETFQVKRISASLPAANILGAYLLAPIFLSIGLYILKAQRKISRCWKEAILVLIIVSGLLLTFSRGALLAFFVGMGFIAVRRSPKIFIILSVLLAFLWILARPAYFSRDDGVTVHDPTVQSRADIWKGAVAMVQEKFWLGHGPNTFHYLFKHYKPQGLAETPYAHNSYLQMLAEIGFVGLMSFSLLLGTIFYTSGKINVRNDFSLEVLGLSVLAAITAMLCHAFVDNVLHALVPATLVWILIGFQLAIFNLSQGIRGTYGCPTQS